ncbi:MAG: bifunctional 5,10-methylenetetrahydrofolate dehydrogenase/5,10-methenyltetrahydrofolate cyclohydrolase [Defluviitaleaceae bacterium]|nr:bifunctional 5,10-methylenetetrahydrofolate dehydrogenase/5,10-methenyltetrahydrofolate cyclohydrolase [Defluviitaleaceae bacterium]
MAIVMDTALLVKNMEEEQKTNVAELLEIGITPTLAIVRAGEKKDSLSYEKSMMKKLERVGILCKSYAYPEDISKEEFYQNVKDINHDDSVHGIIILQPLPKHLQSWDLNYLIEPRKDVDGTNPLSIGEIGMCKIFCEPSTNVPCTAESVMRILDHYNIELSGKDAVVIGASTVVGRPVAFLLLNEEATVTICHIKTKDVKKMCKDADVIVVAVGKKGFITKDFVKEGAIIIDVGINVDENGKVCGDVDFDECIKIAGGITPVPGGVGLVTTAVLAEHVINCALKASANE